MELITCGKHRDKDDPNKRTVVIQASSAHSLHGTRAHSAQYICSRLPQIAAPGSPLLTYCAQDGDPRGKNIVIIDDMVQTGGTLAECCKCLKVLTYTNSPLHTDTITTPSGAATSSRLDGRLRAPGPGTCLPTAHTPSSPRMLGSDLPRVGTAR